MIDRVLEAARSTLPGYASYGSYVTVPVTFVTVALVSSITMGIATALATRKREPWFERARRIFALRVATLGLLVFAPVATTFVMNDFVGPFARPSADVVHHLIVLVAVLAALPAHFIVERAALGPRLTFGGNLRNVWTMAILMSNLPLTIIVLIAMQDLDVPSTLAALIAVVVARLARVVILRRLMRPARERVAEIVRRVAHDRPGLYAREMTTSIANAFAARTRKRTSITFTTGAIDALSDAELEAIAAHELGHIEEAPMIWRLRHVMTLLTDVAIVAFFALRDLGHPAVALLVAFGTFLFNTIARPLITRALESRADHAAREHVGDSNYANAMLRIYEVNAYPLVMRQKGTHGHAYDRAAGAAGLPATRPAPPSLVSSSVVMFTLVSGISFSSTHAMRLVVPACTNEAACTKAAAMTSGSNEYLIPLADARLATKDPRATTLYRAAIEADPSSREIPLHAARRLLAAGECHDTISIIRTLDRRWPGWKDSNDMIALRNDLAACYVKQFESGDHSPPKE